MADQRKDRNEMVPVEGPVYRNGQGEVTSKYRRRLVPRHQIDPAYPESAALRALGVQMADEIGAFTPDEPQPKKAALTAANKRIAELEAQLAEKNKNATPAPDADK